MGISTTRTISYPWEKISANVLTIDGLLLFRSQPRAELAMSPTSSYPKRQRYGQITTTSSYDVLWNRMEEKSYLLASLGQSFSRQKPFWLLESDARWFDLGPTVWVDRYMRLTGLTVLNFKIFTEEADLKMPRRREGAPLGIIMTKKRIAIIAIIAIRTLILARICSLYHLESNRRKDI